MNIPASCFLTPAHKAKEQRALKAAIKCGKVDKEMIPYLTHLNKLPGVMSQYCCSGHNKDYGNLILLLSEKWFQKLLLDPDANMHCGFWYKNRILEIQDSIYKVSWDFYGGVFRMALNWLPKTTKQSMSFFTNFMDMVNRDA
jgi:hypothetical protein